MNTLRDFYQGGRSDAKKWSNSENSLWLAATRSEEEWMEESSQKWFHEFWYE